RGLSMRKLASMVDYSHAALSMVEKGTRQPSKELVSRIQGALEIQGIRIPRGPDRFEVVSLVDLLDNEALAVDVPACHRGVASVVHTALRRNGFVPFPREVTPVEKEKGIAAVFECSDDVTGEFQVTIQTKS
ncbi:MAG: helix-turn-helix transcriptional regulator, partial [Verrucomicrobiota bacterium]